MASAVCSVSGLRKISNNNNNGSNSSGGPDAVYNHVIIILIVNTIIIKLKTILMTNITMIITITAIARGRISMEHQLPLLLPRAEGERFALSPFAGLLQLFFPFLWSCSNPFPFFFGGCSNPFSLVLLIAQQDLNQEARGGNLFNEDEEDIERYIDDDDDDFVDNVRFQDEQVDPKTRHIS